MLTFLQDEESEVTGGGAGGDSSMQNLPAAAGSGGTDSDQQLQEQEYLTVASKGQQVRKTTYMLAVFFGIGLLCIWFMIKKSTPQKATAAIASTEESQIEMAIAKLGGAKSEMSSGMEELVRRFHQFGDVQQVQVGELIKNPFKADGYASSSDDSISDAEKFGVVETMRLLSIVQSGQDRAGRCCMIGDKILYEGDLIRGFKVQQIGDSFVKLQSEGSEMILKLSP